MASSKNWTPKFNKTDSYGSITPPFFGAQLVQGIHYFADDKDQRYLFSMDEDGERVVFGGGDNPEGLKVVAAPRAIPDDAEVLPVFENKEARAEWLKAEMEKLGMTITAEPPPANENSSQDNDGQDNGAGDADDGRLTGSQLMTVNMVEWAKGNEKVAFPVVRKEAKKLGDAIDTTSAKTIRAGMVELGLVKAEDLPE